MDLLHVPPYFPCEEEIIQKSSFIDDIIDSADFVENVNKITKNIFGILSKAGFHIKEWVISNNNVSIDLKEFKIFENKGYWEFLGMSVEMS